MSLISIKNLDIYEQKFEVNTPRSLEACRIEGIEPKDLLYLPPSKFKSEKLTNRQAKMCYQMYEKRRKWILRQVLKTRNSVRFDNLPVMQERQSSKNENCLKSMKPIQSEQTLMQIHQERAQRLREIQQQQKEQQLEEKKKKEMEKIQRLKKDKAQFQYKLRQKSVEKQEKIQKVLMSQQKKLSQEIDRFYRKQRDKDKRLKTFWKKKAEFQDFLKQKSQQFKAYSLYTREKVEIEQERKRQQMIKTQRLQHRKSQKTLLNNQKRHEEEQFYKTLRETHKQWNIERQFRKDEYKRKSIESKVRTNSAKRLNTHRSPRLTKNIIN